MNAQNASEELAQMDSAHSTQDTERKMSPVPGPRGEDMENSRACLQTVNVFLAEAENSFYNI